MSEFTTPSRPSPKQGEGEQTPTVATPAESPEETVQEVAMVTADDAPVMEHCLLRNATAAMLQEREGQGWQIAFEQFVVVEDRVVHCVRMIRVTPPTLPEPVKDEADEKEPEMVVIGLDEKDPTPALPARREGETPAAGMTHIQAVMMGLPADQCMDIARANALAAGRHSLQQSREKQTGYTPPRLGVVS